MKTISKSIQAVGLLLVFLVTACSGGAPQAYDVATAIPEATASGETAGGETAGEIDACALITSSEAMGVLGGPTDDGIGVNSPPLYSCGYSNEDYDTLNLTVTEFATTEDAAASFQATYDYGGYRMVSGVGDQAYEAAPTFDLNVLFGKYEISIDITDSYDADLQLQYAIELAQLVISRLP